MSNEHFFKYAKTYKVCTNCKTPRATSNYVDLEDDVCNPCKELVVVRVQPSDLKIMKCLRCDEDFLTEPKIRICGTCKGSPKYITDAETTRIYNGG